MTPAKLEAVGSSGDTYGDWVLIQSLCAQELEDRGC